MSGMKVVKVFCHEEESEADFDRINEELFRESEKANKYANTLGPILNNIGNVLYVIVAVAGGLLLIGGVVLLVLTQAWRIPVALNAAVALGTLEISVVGTALAFTLYLQGVSDVGGVRASLLACTEPVSATLCAALWLHTSFAWQDLLGFAAILVMAVLIALPERASEKSTEKAEN